MPASYWASRNPLPSASNTEKTGTTYALIDELRDLARGISLEQGQIDIFGVIEMLGALQYHYLQFMRVRDRKISGEIDIDAPDDRFEAVAYIGRIGQICYFVRSDFVKTHFRESIDSQIQSILRLVPFRHKYAAHRARDNPKDKTDEASDLRADLALGAIGGQLSVERVPGLFERVARGGQLDWHHSRRRHLESSYTLYELYVDKVRIEFNLELDHPVILNEVGSVVRQLIGTAKGPPNS